MSKSDDRVLSFFVSGALLAGAAACSKTKGADDHKTNTGHTPTVPHVNEGPATAPPPTATIDAAPGLDPAELRPRHVNEGPMPKDTAPREAAPKPATNVGRKDMQAPEPPATIDDGPAPAPNAE